MPKIKKILILFFFFIGLLAFGHFALAQSSNLDAGLQYGENIGLSQQDPRIVIANIIRIFLGFLGIIAVLLIIYSGWLLMTASGESDKIIRAKKIILGAVIGLIICLSSFAIASFVISQMLGAVNNNLSSSNPPGGQINPPITSPGGGPTLPGFGESCLTFPLDTTCSAGRCAAGLTCGSGCVCETSVGPGLGENCDSDQQAVGCQTTPCSANLVCSPADNCACVDFPLITWVSPVDATSIPNGAVGNFITIGGQYFGTTAGQVIFSDGKVASLPSSVNSNCTDSWRDDQIVVAVPSGAITGPIKVVNSLGRLDATDDDRGPLIKDFQVNNQVRPGLCLIKPSQGWIDQEFKLEGTGFAGANRRVLFGNQASFVLANNPKNWTDQSVIALVPNVSLGGASVFVNIDGANSNDLFFRVIANTSNLPVIDYVDPDNGPTGQYITIYGRNFKLYQPGKSVVKFYLEQDQQNQINADIDFPPACQNRWWRDTYITVKVPAATAGAYKIVVTNSSNSTSSPVSFAITSGTPIPGLCQIEPHNGPIGQAVDFYGDRFGSNQGVGAAIFYNNKAGPVASWSDDKVEANVPSGAATGKIKIKNKDGKESNSLPFTVGACANNAECDSGEECCTGGSQWSGLCRASGTCNQGMVAACTFGWNFSTKSNSSTSNSSTSNSSTSNSPITCSGYSTARACADSSFCPNSPGICQSNSATTNIACTASSCNSLYRSCSVSSTILMERGLAVAATIDNCLYNSSLNKCVFGNLACDSTAASAQFNTIKVCQKVGGDYFWQFNNQGRSCPLGSFLDINGWCTEGSVLSPASCFSCPSGFVCQEDKCVINRQICSANSTCADGFCVSSQASCDCCCRVGQSAQDCCAGLTCKAGGCGTDQINYGLCTGCKVVDAGGTINQAVSDRACDCSGTGTRFCETTDPNYPLGVCRDKATSVGSPCKGAGRSEATSTLLHTSPYSTPGSSNITSYLTTATTTYAYAESMTCNQNNPVCDIGKNLYCADSCTCQLMQTKVATSDISVTGQLCQKNNSPCTIGVESCNPNPLVYPTSPYSCLNKPDNSDCRCCCSPGSTMIVNGKILTCQADKSSCSGADRGLYCGCLSDSECISGTGCGFDTCCHPRPTVVSTTPQAGEIGICRNAMISAVFDQKMDVASFNGNIIVAADFENNICPAGTNYLTLDNVSIIDKLFAWLSRLPLINQLFLSRSASALSGNFCAIDGLVKGYNLSDGTSKLTFSPSKAMPAGKKHYVIIKGDENLSDNLSVGVLNSYNVGMAGTTEQLNGKNYKNIKIWSFTTKAETGSDQGICSVNSVAVEPVNYLFSTSVNDASDDGGSDDKDDSDKLYAALAKNINGQAVVAMPGIYDWSWSWKISNEVVAKIRGGQPESDSQTVEAQNIQDDSTQIRARATITKDSVNQPSSVGKYKEGQTNIYVFLCSNPWPPKQTDGSWSHWEDKRQNCTIGDNTANDCKDMGFSFYYCRDAGGPGTADDLPAVLSDRGIVLAPAGQTAILKEFYFFREDLPNVSAINLAISSIPAEGGKVRLAWSAITPASGETMDSYIVYYGLAAGKHTNSKKVASSTPTVTIDGLINKTAYYFAATARYASGAESEYSNEVSATPLDLAGPSAPALIGIATSSSKIFLGWQDRSNGDAKSFIIYYGYKDTASNNCNFGSTVNVSYAVSGTTTISNLSNGVEYCFKMIALDSYKNSSDPSNILSGKPSQ